MEASGLTALVGSTWFGGSFRAPTRERLAALGELVDFPEGSVVVHEGRPCDALGLVTS